MKIDYSYKNLNKNSYGSLVIKLFSVLVTIITTHLILRILGEELYGVWVSIVSVASWIYYLDLGIGDGLRIKLTESLAICAYKKARGYIKNAYVLSNIMSIFVAIIFILGTKIINLYKFLNIDKDVCNNLNSIIVTVTFFVCVNFVLSLSNNIYYAIQKPAYVVFGTLVYQILYLFGIIVLLFNHMYYSILFLVVIDGASQLFKNILSMLWVFRNNKELIPRKERMSRKNSGVIIKIGLKSFLIKVSALVLNATDNVIILKFIGGKYVTNYSICFNYFNMITILMATMVVTYQSSYTALMKKHDVFGIKRNMKKSLMIFMVYVCATLVGSLLFRTLSYIWLGYKLEISNKLIFLFSIYAILLMITHLFSVFLNGIGKINAITFAAMIQIVLNIPVSVFFIKFLGGKVEGAILGTVLSTFVSAVIYVLSGVKEYKKILEEVY